MAGRAPTSRPAAATETSAGRTTSYTWDLGGRLTGETHQGGERLAYGYVNDLLATVTAYDSSVRRPEDSTRRLDQGSWSEAGGPVRRHVN